MDKTVIANSNRERGSKISQGLEICLQKVNDLFVLIEDLEPGFSSSTKRVRKWSALKWVLRESKIKKFKQSLGEAKTTLILALQISSVYVSLVVEWLKVCTYALDLC